MSSTNEAATRKPSGSSTHSGGQSPSHSPNHGNSHHKLPASAGKMFGVGMGTASGLKGLNAGWQVWGNSAPSTRNPSSSSIASISDQSTSQVDAAFLSNLGDTWGSRSTSGTWDEMADHPQMKEQSQLESHGVLPMHQGRQRPVGVPQVPSLTTASTTMSKPGQFSPQRHENSLTKEPVTPSRYSAASPTRPPPYAVSTSPFSGQQSLLQGSSPRSVVENELSLAMRGMAVEDDYSPSHQNSVYRQQPSGYQQSAVSTHAGQTSQSAAPQARGPPQIQPRTSYGTYPPTDYSAYYTGPAARVEYPYGYDAYRMPSEASLYAASPAVSHAAVSQNAYAGMMPQPLHPDVTNSQSGIFYDYSASARAISSQYYYPTQPMVYHGLPSPSPMMSPHTPTTLQDKKRDMQYNIQQQITLPNLMYPNVRPTPSPHPQTYVDYSQVAVMGTGGPGYGRGVGMQFNHGRSGRRGDFVDHQAPIRSALLDDFRANKTSKWELRDIFGHVVEFSGDQHGSRFIQQKLEVASPEEKQIVFDEIVPHNTLQLIQDVFGNYVIQKFFEYGTPVQKAILANSMEGHILPLSLQMYGCRVVQKAIEYVIPEQQGIFVKELDANVLRCVKDANGNHVVQKLIEHVAPERLGFVSAFQGHVHDLSTHPYGCRVLQRCFEHLPAETVRPLLDELHKYASSLMQDQFGNYVIQFVLEHGDPQDRAAVIAKLRGHMLNMARHKFASNVCEKALVTADSESRRLLIEEIMTAKQDGPSPIMIMMKDQFANYVLQRALSVVEGEQRETLIGKVRGQLTSMRRFNGTSSKHLVAIERLVERCATASPGETVQLENIATPGSDAISPK